MAGSHDIPGIIRSAKTSEREACGKRLQSFADEAAGDFREVRKRGEHIPEELLDLEKAIAGLPESVAKKAPDTPGGGQ